MTSVNDETYSLSDSESDESCCTSSSEHEIEVEELEYSTNCDHSECQEQDPYSEEPLANEQWLEEYDREIKRLEAHHAKLQDRLHGRIDLLSWCKCGRCQTGRLQNLRECQCCHELKGCVEACNSELVIEELGGPPTYITLHPGFSAVCLNRWSLRSASAKYKTIDGRKYTQTGTEHELYRATAYREFTQLAHGYLGEKRIPLPACAYDSIRGEFSNNEDNLLDMRKKIEVFSLPLFVNFA